jgi:hypothetical protein
MAATEGLLPSPDLIHRTLRIENSYTVSRMKVLEGFHGPCKFMLSSRSRKLK